MSRRNRLRVLVACEFSGVVRDAFRERGHLAVSCDLLPSERPGPHVVGDVLDLLDAGWDLLIAHPPCTHLCVSGARWFGGKAELQEEAIDFFLKFLNAPVPQIAVENPVGVIGTRVSQPDQIVHPWMFGDPYSKQTCWWLKNLPPLRPTEVVSRGEFHTTRGGNVLPKWYNLPPSEGRASERSRTFPGMAGAMAEQWGDSLDYNWASRNGYRKPSSYTKTHRLRK